MKQDVDLDIIDVTLLSGEEYREVKDIIPKFHHPSCWWLRKPFGNWGVGFQQQSPDIRTLLMFRKKNKKRGYYIW